MSYSKEMLEAISEGELIDAQEKFEQAMILDTPEEKYQLAAYLFELGFLEESEQLYQNLLADFPEEEGIKISLAEIAIENDDIGRAQTLLNDILPSSDVYVQSLLTQADLYQQLDIPEVSQQKLREAKLILPDEPLIDLALAELFFSIEDYNDAVPIYEELLVAEDSGELASTISITERLGVALSRMGNFEEAVMYLEQAIERDETAEALFQLALTYYQLEELERTTELLQHIKELNEEFLQVYYPLAQALSDQGLFDEAAEVAQIGIDKNPYDLNLYHVASIVAYQLGQSEDAKQQLMQAIALDDSDFSKLKLAELLLKEDDYDDVIDLVDQLENSEQGHAQWYLAQAYNGLEEYEQAKIAFNLAKIELADEPGFIRDYGLFLREEGQLDETKKWLTHYLTFVPDDIEVVELLSSIGGD